MENKKVMRSFFNLMKAHRTFIAQSVEKEGGVFYGQLPILEMVLTQPDCTQKEIADRFEISPASVTKTLKVFEKKGLVERIQSEKDCRCLKLKITPKGIKALEIQKKLFQKTDEIIFEGIEETEKQFLYDIFEKMLANLERKDNEWQ